jgi:hypothetical protein
MSNGENAPVHAMQPPGFHTPPNGIATHARGTKLRYRYHPILLTRDSRNHPIWRVAFPVHMTYKATQAAILPPILV